MSQIKIITERVFTGPLPIVAQIFERGIDTEFCFFNMCPDGVWLVDRRYPKFEDIKTTALLVANTFGDVNEIDKINLMTAL